VAAHWRTNVCNGALERVDPDVSLENRQCWGFLEALRLWGRLRRLRSVAVRSLTFRLPPQSGSGTVTEVARDRSRTQMACAGNPSAGGNRPPREGKNSNVSVVDNERTMRTHDCAIG